jgi:hypothetical protein
MLVSLSCLPYAISSQDILPSSSGQQKMFKTNTVFTEALLLVVWILMSLGRVLIGEA